MIINEVNQTCGSDGEWSGDASICIGEGKRRGEGKREEGRGEGKGGGREESKGGGREEGKGRGRRVVGGWGRGGTIIGGDEGEERMEGEEGGRWEVYERRGGNAEMKYSGRERSGALHYW
jgi:hypothetical protein